MNQPSKPVSAGLYLIATPIGNARDITLRALDLLATADVLAAEDTRSLRRLLQIHGVALGGRPLIAVHDHSGAGVIARLVDAVAAGKSVVYASEAGTPLVSDPGFTLARAVRAAGLAVTAAPGASAVLSALTVSGLPAERFAFLGFLPAARTARRTALADLVQVPFTLVLYESANRVGEMLEDMCQILGEDREGAICRELTKRFEEVRRGTLRELAIGCAAIPPRGEIVVLAGPPGLVAPAEQDVKKALVRAMATLRIKDAATVVAGAMGLPRRDVYQIALRLEDDA